ncbi:helix-turn-helix domain-containing protein [Dactylosporangium aurantiacum]|uniref:Helix-turn-helix domain-containing protein n=1 Tax=Dactylosporangium aurantiacum TaxID=35754 RepID=A0A9Q9MI94_9ACTN|nr:helix-turn-helix transcriptional regulator [Dactylosporangium aurantiacum]MDG6103161.1 helix-turn-helix transcriptional regulator [Dactylosporangium aurantiacum]UWZ57669.1 helix-turn-helix domain-containing protein [Dactylosporangium aurantiacum]
MDRRQLADFLRARRERVRPVDAGLAPGPRRRTPGLRREEVAQLAGISVDYYTRLEQARGPRPSRQVLTALARAMRLTDSEREHLFQLVGARDDPPAGPPRDVPTGILHLIDRLDDTPAFVIDAVYNLLAWNRMATALLIDPTVWPVADRNLIWQLFSSPYTDFDDPQIDEHARLCLADLRRAVTRYPDDPGVAALVARLHATGPGFVRRWVDYPVDPPRSTSTKRIPHPVVGELELDCQTLHITERDQRLVLYTAAPGSRSQEGLRLLSVVGTQRF